MLLLPGTAVAQLQGEPQALLKWHQGKNGSCTSRVLRAFLSCAATQPLTSPCDSCAASAPGQHHPVPCAALWFERSAVPCKPPVISCAIISQTALWELILGSSFAPAQGDPSVTGSSAAQSPLQVPGQPLLTNCNISRASHSHSQTAAPFSHRRYVFLASHCCDSFAKSISRGDLEQGHSCSLAHYPSWSSHLELQGHPQHSGFSGILKCKEKGTRFGNAVAALLGTCKAGLKVWSRKEMRNKSLQQADPHLATDKHQTRSASWLQQHSSRCSHLSEVITGLCEAAQ